MPKTIIDLIRHGQPIGGSLYRGHNIDDPLSDIGWQQMREATSGNIPWSEIITSPMKRCLAFAEELSSNNNLTLSIEPDFKEVGFGSWEGQTREQLKSTHLQEYKDFYRDPVNCRPPGAEDLDSFIQRVTQAYIKQSTNNADKHVLIVAHAGVIRAIIAHTLHAKPLGLYRIKVDNGRLTRLALDSQGGNLLYHNARLQDMTD